MLEELRDTRIGSGERLLDELDVITAVSGGSFVAAYYGLNGEVLFDEFEERFLKHDVQGDLVRGLLAPMNFLRVAFTSVGRSDLAAECYDERLFGGATFGDLAQRMGPFVRINATDLSSGEPFPSIQRQFDLLCSDLSSFPWPGQSRHRRPFPHC